MDDLVPLARNDVIKWTIVLLVDTSIPLKFDTGYRVVPRYFELSRLTSSGLMLACFRWATVLRWADG